MQIGIDGNEANVQNRVGSGQYAFELLREFAKIKDKKYGFTVYLKDNPLPDLPKSTPNFVYKVFGPKKFWTQFALSVSLTFGQKPDIFFSTAHYGPRFSRVPYVVTVHDLSYLYFPELFKKNDLYQLTNWTKYSIKNATHIIAVSQTTKNDIVINYHVSPTKVTVTYEGYDQDRFKPQPKSKVEKIKSKYKINEDYVIFVGTLQPRKNLESLIDAFNSLKLEIDNLKLVIVGKKGWLYDSIFSKVKDLNLDQKVIFTGYIPDNDLSALISGAEVYVLPSLLEGFGIPVIEAQACGVPVVVSKTSSLPEIVGASGILVDPQDVNSIASGIKKVLTKNEIRSDLIKKGFINIKRFSWEKCASQTLHTLEKFAASQKPPADIVK